MEFLEKIAKQLIDEVEGYSTYKELYDLTDDVNEKNKIAHIMEQEKEHYMALDEIIKSYM